MSRGWQGDGFDGEERLTYVPQMLDVIWGIDQVSHPAANLGYLSWWWKSS